MKKLKKLFSLLGKIFKPFMQMKWKFFLYSGQEFVGKIYALLGIQVSALIISAVEQKDVHLLYRYIIFFAVLSILGLSNEWIRSRSRTKLNVYIRTILNKKYLQNFIDADNNKIESYGTGRMSNIIFSGVDGWVHLVLNAIIPLLGSIVGVVYGFIIIASSVNFVWLMLFLAIFVLGSIFIILSFSKSAKYRKAAKKFNIILDRRKIKILMSKFEIFQNDKFKSESEFLDNVSDDIFSTRWKYSVVRNLWDIGSFLVTNGGRILIYIIFGLAIINGQYSISYLVLLIGLMRRISWYLWDIKSYSRGFAEEIVHVEKLRNTMENIPPIETSKKKENFILKKGNIKIKNINFSYGETEKIFQNFSLNIQGGKKTALVGESGSGKSTLIKLMSGYVHTQDGTISVDKQSLKYVSLKSFYRHIGYLTQEPSVFDGTIIENLTYALSQGMMNDEEGKMNQKFEKQLHKVIKDAKCEFIWDFEKGLKTEIGEKGIKLSGGQKQRLAIAKIMLKNPEIIFLDEPTSALDSVSEQKVSDALQNLFKGRTVVVVAHRLQTVKESDEIIVLDRGKIIERGTHAELSKNGGMYKRMLDLQTSF